jgi:hypothetical protein
MQHALTTSQRLDKKASRPEAIQGNEDGKASS